MSKLNIEEEFKQILSIESPSIDADSFLANLHGERARRQSKREGFFNGIGAAILVISLGVFTTFQMSDDPTTVQVVDLFQMETLDEETELFLYDMAEYLIQESDDIWETMAFLDETNFEPISEMMEDY